MLIAILSQLLQRILIFHFLCLFSVFVAGKSFHFWFESSQSIAIHSHRFIIIGEIVFSFYEGSVSHSMNGMLAFYFSL
jgi:hypothetical protein